MQRPLASARNSTFPVRMTGPTQEPGRRSGLQASPKCVVVSAGLTLTKRFNNLRFVLNHSFQLLVECGESYVDDFLHNHSGAVWNGGQC
jgi:hypothetical protein